MKRLALSFILLAAIPQISAAATTPALLPPRIEEAITKRIADGEYPAMVVAVVDGDRSHVYGFGKLSNGKPPGSGTVFQIGSVTKTNGTYLSLFGWPNRRIFSRAMARG